ncbi:hypothetical protein KJ707_00160 [Patescibacteria group bacterium]|nr:hypothetical protein [Patescibacteria group bacterium]
MLTQQDKKYLNKTFVTKKYLHENFVTKKDHDQFVDSVAAEFSRIHEKFAAIDERFDEMDQRFDKLENLINEVLLEVRSIGTKLDATIKRVDKIELHLGLAIA